MCELIGGQTCWHTFENNCAWLQCARFLLLIWFIWSPGFTFSRIQELENSGYFFGICSNDVPLCNGPNMEYFAVGRQ